MNLPGTPTHTIQKETQSSGKRSFLLLQYFASPNIFKEKTWLCNPTRYTILLMNQGPGSVDFTTF